MYGDDLVAFRKHVKKYKQRGLQVIKEREELVEFSEKHPGYDAFTITSFVSRWNTRSGDEMERN